MGHFMQWRELVVIIFTLHTANDGTTAYYIIPISKAVFYTHCTCPSKYTLLIQHKICGYNVVNTSNRVAIHV